MTGTCASQEIDELPWVAKAAAIIRAAGIRPEQGPILNRLTTDPRMTSVWRELKRHQPSRAKGQPPQSQKDIHADAMARTLHLAFRAAADGRTATTVEGPQKKARELHHEAAILRRVAEDVVASVGHAPEYIAEHQNLSQWLADAQALCRVADWRESVAAEIRGNDDPLTISNARGDPLVRGVQITIASFLKEEFGHFLYGTAATLAAVALGLSRAPSARVSRSAFSRPKSRQRSRA